MENGQRRGRYAVVRAPFEGRTWREFGHIMVGFPLSTLYFCVAVTLLSAGAGLLVTFLGVPLLAWSLGVFRGFGAVERARARGLLGLEVAAPAPLRRAKGPLAWMGAMLKSGANWRHALYMVIHFPWAVFSFCVALTFMTYGWAMALYPAWQWVFPTFTDQPGLQLYGDGHGDGFYLDSPLRIAAACAVGVLLVFVTPWLVRGLAAVDRALVAGLLGPSRLADRVTELESDRGVVVDTAAADLRRIERDLHDGAQARLVNLAMDLGLAKEKLPADPQAAARMVDEAHGEVKLALQELRDLARGIHPAVLTDRGLDAALSSLAARCTVPVRVQVELPARPAPAIEGIAYFTVSELLQNISKHSGARSAGVDIWRSGERLMIQVSDDGRGGAAVGGGTGLAGLTERIGAVDGVLLVESPEAGGTRVTAELPWRG
ncbi:sensor domain-containing protein [Streptomyces sp. NPDC089919]|uniref:sensor histidine kinase n=1 Tax=Streptomyces sp. NPDC089919 TaxID=3155188 RepID=UPI00342D0339